TPYPVGRSLAFSRARRYPWPNRPIPGPWNWSEAHPTRRRSPLIDNCRRSTRPYWRTASHASFIVGSRAAAWLGAGPRRGGELRKRRKVMREPACGWRELLGATQLKRARSEQQSTRCGNPPCRAALRKALPRILFVLQFRHLNHSPSSNASCRRSSEFLIILFQIPKRQGGDHEQTGIFDDHGGCCDGCSHASGVCGYRNAVRPNGRSTQGDAAVAFGAAARFGLSGSAPGI